MARKLSGRLREIVDALPLKEGLRVWEIGCGSGAAAREVAKHVPGGRVLGIDRSSKAVGLAVVNSEMELASGVLSFRTENPTIAAGLLCLEAGCISHLLF